MNHKERRALPRFRTLQQVNRLPARIIPVSAVPIVDHAGCDGLPGGR